MSGAHAKGHRVFRAAGMILIGAVLAIGVGLVALAKAPDLFGYRSIVVYGGSMSPTLEAGDVILVSEISPGDVKVGDVITYTDSNATSMTTHRVVAISGTPTSPIFETQGDANTDLDPVGISADRLVGRMSLRVPLVGRALDFAGTPKGRIVLVGLPLILLAVEETRVRLARRGQTKDDSGTQEYTG